MNALDLDISLQPVESTLINIKQLELIIARLDLIDPVISGNKIFKLHYFIEEALLLNKKTIVTCGGAFSNHLAATAHFCKAKGLNCIGLVRGEAAENISHTLLQCKADDMKLVYIDRNVYADINQDNFVLHIPAELDYKADDGYFIPEGGFHPLGANGASLIMEKISNYAPTHIITAIGTATTMAGVLKNAVPEQRVLGISVLKGMTDIETRLAALLPETTYTRPVIFHDYHFGGYAKKTEPLINFMNDFYRQYQIPTDFVYTGKMMFGVIDLLKKDYFPAGSRILCLHTGGLQGNLSLPKGSLVF
jgi:1-aminocyclopropane-1-carboxylate deaminase